MSDRLCDRFYILCDRFICDRMVRAVNECPTWGCIDSVLLFCVGWGKEEEIFTFVQSSEKVIMNAKIMIVSSKLLRTVELTYN